MLIEEWQDELAEMVNEQVTKVARDALIRVEREVDEDENSEFACGYRSGYLDALKYAAGTLDEVMEEYVD